MKTKAKIKTALPFKVTQQHIDTLQSIRVGIAGETINLRSGLCGLISRLYECDLIKKEKMETELKIIIRVYQPESVGMRKTGEGDFHFPHGVVTDRVIYLHRLCEKLRTKLERQK